MKQLKKLAGFLMVIALLISAIPSVFADDATGPNNGTTYYSYWSGNSQTMYLNQNGSVSKVSVGDLWVTQSDKKLTTSDLANLFAQDDWRSNFVASYCIDLSTGLSSGQNVYNSPQDVIDAYLKKGSEKEQKVRHMLSSAEAVALKELGIKDPLSVKSMKDGTQAGKDLRVFKTALQFACWNVIQGHKPVPVSDYESGKYNVVNTFTSKAFATKAEKDNEIAELKRIETLYNAFVAEAGNYKNAPVVTPELKLSVNNGSAKLTKDKDTYYYGPMKAETVQNFDKSKLESVFLKASSKDMTFVDANKKALPEKVQYGSNATLPYTEVGQEFYVKIPAASISKKAEFEATIRAKEASTKDSTIIFSAPTQTGGLSYTAAQMTIGIVKEGADIYANIKASFALEGTLKVIKVDKDDNTHKLPGAEFKIYDAQGNVVKDNVKTDANGEFKITLPYGKYYLEETKAPDGYVALSNDKVEIVIDDSTTACGTIPHELVVGNKQAKGSVEITKTDVVDGTPLPNTGIEILDENKNVIVQGRTDENGIIKFDELPIGNYYFREFDAPQGYLIDENPHAFEVKKDGEIVKCEMTNARGKGDVEVTKSDVADGTLLPKTGIEILDKNKNVIIQGRTDENGVVRFENLLVGDYYFREFDAPKGYQIDENPYAFSIKENGEIVKCQITNAKEAIAVPKTSDDTINPLLIGGILVVAAGAIVVLIILKKKRNNS